MLQQAHCNSGAQWEEHRFLCGNIFSISHLFIDHFSVTTAVLLRTVYSTTCRQVIKGNEMIPFAFKGWILKTNKKKQLLFRLTKMKHSQHAAAAAAAAVDEDLISLLMNDPLLLCQRLLRQNSRETV